MRRLNLFVICSIILLASCGDHPQNESNSSNAENANQSESIAAGQQLFQANCSVCHSLDPKTPSGMAPVLENIAKHWPEKDVLAKYIKNAPAMMQANKRSREIFREWKDKAQMPPFSGLSATEIDNIILYLYNNS